MKWQSLNVDEWPEESGTRIFCNKCSQKNRSDDGWIYRVHSDDSPFSKRRNQEELFAKTYFGNCFETGGGIQKNEYMCKYCKEHEIIGFLDINKLSVKQLRDHLRNLNQLTSGKKSELQERLSTLQSSRETDIQQTNQIMDEFITGIASLPSQLRSD